MSRKPEDVTEEQDLSGKLTTWTRRTAKGNLVVSYVPSRHLKVRAQQERDLAQHLDDRTEKA